MREAAAREHRDSRGPEQPDRRVLRDFADIVEEKLAVQSRKMGPHCNGSNDDRDGDPLPPAHADAAATRATRAFCRAFSASLSASFCSISSPLRTNLAELKITINPLAMCSTAAVTGET